MHLLRKYNYLNLYTARVTYHADVECSSRRFSNFSKCSLSIYKDRDHMESSWPYVKFSWLVMLYSEPFFQPINRKVGTFQGLSLYSVVLSHIDHHIVCKAVITFHRDWSSQKNLHSLCGCDDHLSVLILLRQCRGWKT